MRSTGGESRAELDAWARQHSASLLRLAYLLTGDAGLAEDLVQATFAKLYARWSRFLDVEEQLAYARRVMINDRASRARARRVTEVPADLTPAIGRVEPGLGRVEDRSQLGPALAQLPPRQRTAVVLRYLEDMSERETAAAMGCSVGSVKSHASRGLAALRLELAPELTKRPTLTEGEHRG